MERRSMEAITGVLPEFVQSRQNDGPVSTKAKLVGIAMALFAAFGGFLYGYDTGYISGNKEMQYWLKTFGDSDGEGNYFLTTATDSLVTSILTVGTFIGSLLAYPLGDICGRRRGIILSCAVFSIGVALETASTTIPLFTAGRIFAGLGVGLTSCLVPMYQSECAPKWIRGAVVSCYQWTITIGLLVAAVVVQATKDIDNANCYRIPIAIQFIWAFILAAGLFCLPESPKYLIFMGREQEAKDSLGRLLSLPSDSPQVKAEFLEVDESLKVERALAAPSYWDCFQSGPGKYRLRNLTGMGVQALQQLTGINFIFYYGTTFFRKSGIKDPFTVTIITNVVNVVMTLPGIWLVDKAGRRSLLLYGAAAMSLCEFAVAILGIKVESSDMVGQNIMIAVVCLYIGAFSSTWGPVAWVVTSEIYPLAIRAKAMSMSMAAHWGINFAVSFMTPYLVDVGPGKAGLQSNVFFIWGGCCALCFVFTFLFVPETKGLSLEQVDQLYMNSSILKSNAYRKKMIKEACLQNGSRPGSVADDVGDKREVKP